MLINSLLFVLALDILKGASPVAFAAALGRDDWVLMAAAALVVVGHIFPPWLGFNGGRGAASSVGASFALLPLTAGPLLAVGLAVLSAMRNTSIAIAVFVVSLLLLVVLTGGDGSRLAFAIALFIAASMKDAWDRVQRRRSVNLLVVN